MTPTPHREPRPLPLHMAIQTMTWMSSRAALPHLSNESLIWRAHTAKAAKKLAKKLDGIDPAVFAAALDAEAHRRQTAFIDGVKAYRHHHHRRSLDMPPSVWCEGSTRLLDYGHAGKAGGKPVLVVPSLINRAYILDLAPGSSLVRYLGDRGFHPFLVDWGTPTDVERGFTLDDYIADRLENALDTVCRIGGNAAGVIGYCMGGLLALGLAQRRPEQTSGLALLATPWDFSATSAAAIRMLKAAAPQIAFAVDSLGELPVDLLQAMFTSLNPFLTTRKFRHFAELDMNCDMAKSFVVLEDWLNDGVALSGPVAKQCLFGWYLENKPMLGRWKIRGRTVIPDEVKTPALVVIPEKDHIVPPLSAAPLSGKLPQAQTLNIAAGHIGMMVGRRAEKLLYEPLADWLDETAH